MEVYVLPVGGLEENCYIVQSSAKNAVLIDPGDDYEQIVRSLEGYSLTPKMIILTHGHFDHIGAVAKLRERYGIKVYIHENDAELLADIQKNRARYFKLDKSQYVIEADEYVKDGDELSLDELTFKIIHTPGHTQGSICIICGGVMFTGDTLFPGECGRCDMYGGDFTMMLESLQKLKNLEGNYTVLPGHGPSTTLQAERENNQYMNMKA